MAEMLGRGRVAEVLVHGEHVLKAYLDPASKADAFREAATLATIEDFGLPVPRVIEAGRYDGRWGFVMTRAHGKPFFDTVLAGASDAPAYIDAMVRLHIRIHGKTAPTLPAHKAKLASAISRAAIDDTLRKRLLAALDALPAGTSLCHLDFHPQNVLGTPADAMVVDWLDAAAGGPAADVCRSWVIIAPHVPDLADRYVDAYIALSGIPRDDILRWRPVIAGGRLAENVPERDFLMALAETA